MCIIEKKINQKNQTNSILNYYFSRHYIVQSFSTHWDNHSDIALNVCNAS